MSNVIEDINFVNMKKEKVEAMDILSEFIPKVQKFSAKINSYNDYIRELEIRINSQRKDNIELAKENNELKEKIEDKEFEMGIKLQDMEKKLNKYEKYIKKVPKEILDEINAKERDKGKEL